MATRRTQYGLLGLFFASSIRVSSSRSFQLLHPPPKATVRSHSVLRCIVVLPIIGLKAYTFEESLGRPPFGN
jgi:hypothetical protein